MCDKDIYHEFCTNVFRRLCSEVNGKIVYELYERADTVVFKVFFKDFDFGYAVNNASQVIYTGATEQVVSDFIDTYKRAIRNAFFKSEDRKNRDKMKGENNGIHEIR